MRIGLVYAEQFPKLELLIADNCVVRFADIDGKRGPVSFSSENLEDMSNELQHLKSAFKIDQYIV